MSYVETLKSWYIFMWNVRWKRLEKPGWHCVLYQWRRCPEIYLPDMGETSLVNTDTGIQWKTELFDVHVLTSIEPIFSFVQKNIPWKLICQRYIERSSIDFFLSHVCSKKRLMGSGIIKYAYRKNPLCRCVFVDLNNKWNV